MSLPNKKRTGNGFTLAEALCSMICTMMIVELALAFVWHAALFWQQEDDRMKQFAVVQLRLRCAAASSAAVEEEHLMIVEHGEEKEIGFKSGRLAASPGYEILLEGIEYACFIQEEGKVWLEIYDEGRKEKWQIA